MVDPRGSAADMAGFAGRRMGFGKDVCNVAHLVDCRLRVGLDYAFLDEQKTMMAHLFSGHDKRFGNPKEIRIRLCSSELNFILRLDNETHHLRR